MITVWLEAPPVYIFLVLVGLYGGTTLALLRLGAALSGGPRCNEWRGVAPQFLSVVAVLFALQAGFLAADISQRNQRAIQSVASEASALVTLNSLVHAVGVEADGVRRAAAAYAASVVKDEWPQLGRAGEAAATAAALDALLKSAAGLNLTDQHNPAIHGSILSTAVTVMVARGDRLAVATEGPNEMKWMTVLLLGLLAQVTLIFPHLGNPVALRTVLHLFALGTVILLGLMGLQENPFAPPAMVSPEAIEKVLNSLAASS